MMLFSLIYILILQNCKNFKLLLNPWHTCDVISKYEIYIYHNLDMIIYYIYRHCVFFSNFRIYMNLCKFCFIIICSISITFLKTCTYVYTGRLDWKHQ